jgi:hypothetical protein
MCVLVSCVCLCIVVSNTYCVVFLFCLSSTSVPYVAGFSGLFLFCLSLSSVPYVASFSGLSIFDCHYGILQHLFQRVTHYNIDYYYVLIIIEYS